MNAYKVSQADSLSIQLSISDKSDYMIDWGDGNVTKALSNQIRGHRYDSIFSGFISFPKINNINISKMQLFGEFAFDIEQLFDFAPNLDSLILNQRVICYGDLSKKPSTLTYIDIQTGKFYGHLSKKNLERMTRLRLVDSNTVTLDIQDFDTSINYIGITGENTVYGTIDSMNYPKLHHFDVKGKNSISGDIGTMISFPSVFSIRGNNTLSEYSQSKFNFIGSPSFISIAGLYSSLTSEMIDRMIIDLDKSASKWKNPALVILTGQHKSPSIISQEARESLKDKGVKLYTN